MVGLYKWFDVQDYLYENSEEDKETEEAEE